jgi:hypothetical protein
VVSRRRSSRLLSKFCESFKGERVSGDGLDTPQGVQSRSFSKLLSFAKTRMKKANRHVGTTDFNAHSSRSHTIFQLVVESCEKGSGSLQTKRSLLPTGSARKQRDSATRASTLVIVDF